MAEPSEGFFAGAVLCKDSELSGATTNETTLRKFINTLNDAYDDRCEGAGNDKATFKRLITLHDEVDKSKFYTDAIVGVSAAKAVKSFMKQQSTFKTQGEPVKAYLTGKKWPEKVSKFKFEAFGMADYNSSDVIVEYKNGNRPVYLGVSLKKKPKPTAPDPTIINKAFDTIMNGSSQKFNKIKTDLQTARQNFFAGVIKDAMISGPLAGLAELPDGTNPRNATNEKLWTTKIPVRKNGKVVNVDLINLKDIGNFDDPALLNTSEISTTDANAMRDFVNSKLGKVGNQPNTLYKQFLAVIKSEQDLFANTLINLVLKKELMNQLSELTDNDFDFVLCTGIGECKVNKSGLSITESKGTTIGMDSIALALAAMRRAKKTIEIDAKKTAASKAAKLYFKLKADTIELLDLELRYKGSFKHQPQFQAYIATGLKKLLTGDGQFANIKRFYGTL